MLSKILFAFFLLTMSLQASWSEYKKLYISKDGRVVDRANSDITHSESIGYALYLALQNGDFETFSSIYLWYKNNLKKNQYGLVSWKWGKDKQNNWHILDTNNATDGDLWIAYDNLLMYEISKGEIYKSEALKLMENIKKQLLVKEAGSVYLLPGKVGFESKNSIEINLSYYLFFIFDKFGEYDDDTIWKQLKNDGITLLQKARFSSLKLNPDWISVDKNSQRVYVSKNNTFGYDALRIPFNILNSDIKNKKVLLQPYINYVNSMKMVDAVYGVCNLTKGSISLYNYSYAHLSIYNMLDKVFNKHQTFSKQLKKLKEQNRDDYYSYSIYLMCNTL